MTAAAAQVVIVGAGLAGLELAHHLQRAGVDGVVVVEQAPDTTPGVHNNVALDARDAMTAWLGYDADPHFRRGWTSTTPPHYAAGSGERAVLGGRSRYWYGVCLPIESWALTAWPDAVRHDLTQSWRGGPGLYDVVRDDLGIRPDPDAHLSLGGSLLVAPTPHARTEVHGSADRWFAYSPLDHWRDPVSGALDASAAMPRIVPGARVRRVLTANGRAVGVEYDDAQGAVQELFAGTVVLAAGTIPGAALALTALPGAPGRRLAGLVDHIVQGFFVRLRGDAADALLRRWPAGSWYAPLGETVRSNLFVEVVPKDAEVRIDVRVTGEQEATAASSVGLPAPGVLPDVEVRLTAADRELLDRQRDVLREVWRAVTAATGDEDGGRTLQFLPYEEQVRGNDALVDDRVDELEHGVPMTWSSFLGTEDHESGTLPLGSVVDDDLQVVEVPGLYAVGPCVFPRSGAANPSLTTLALARRLAATLAERHVAPAPGAA